MEAVWHAPVLPSPHPRLSQRERGDSSMTEPPRFLFATCQVGAEQALKAEMARQSGRLPRGLFPAGLLDVEAGPVVRAGRRLQAAFGVARSHGFSLGPVKGSEPTAMADEVWRLVGERPCRRIHVWPRDTARPGEHGFEPGVTDECRQIKELLRERCPRPGQLSPPTACQIGRFRGANWCSTAFWWTLGSGGSATIGPDRSPPGGRAG